MTVSRLNKLLKMKQYKYRINGSLYNVVVNKTTDDIAEVEVNGTPYTVEIEKKSKKQKTSPFKKPAQAPTAHPAPSPQVTKQPSAAGANSLTSPLPGVILDISCSVGDTVKKGQKLMILEAMKMENNIMADRDGVIKEIKVQSGTTVLEGTELIVIEG